MAVRFVNDKLIDDDGAEVQISYETLLNACLEGEHKTPSIKAIVFGGVQRLTGQRVVQNRYRESSLFKRLEKGIIADEKYQKLKANINEKRKKVKETPTERYIAQNPDKARWKRIRLRNQIKRRVYKCCHTAAK